MPDKKFGDEERQIWEFSNAGPVHYYIVREEPSSEMPLPPPQWALDLKAELGMPAGAVWRRHTTPGVVFGECWRDYTLQFFGMLISNEHEGPWPSWRVLDRAGKIVENVQIWYQRASHALSPISCEVRWHPEKGETVTFPGLENAEKQKDITLAWRGKTLLQKVARRGRAFGTVTLTKDVFLERALRAFKQWYDERGEEPTDVQLAEELLISRATLYRYLRDYDTSLAQIRDRALSL